MINALLICLFFGFCYSQKKGFIDFNYYYDSNKSTILTINTASSINTNFSYFGFINFYNSIDAKDLSNIESFYSEQNVRWNALNSKSIDFTLQWNLRSGLKSDRLRLGIRLILSKVNQLKSLFKLFNMSYSINYHFYQLDSDDIYNWQMEHVYRIKITEKIYLSGFADHSFGGEINPKIVSEHQIGYLIYNNFYIIYELRINQYRKGKELSSAIGLEYIIKF